MAACTSHARRDNSQQQTAGMMAPDFSLTSTEGRQVSLSQMRGKYVVIDFWGSWCHWCIKGFPELKAFYAKHKDKVEVVGIDCGDTDAQWRKAVADHKLPWISVKNGEGSQDMAKAYGVSGFPTKYIVSPKGELLGMAVGDDPSFFDKLEELLRK